MVFTAALEFGILLVEQTGDRTGATRSFVKGCDLGFVAACQNSSRMPRQNGAAARGALTATDLPLVLRGGKGPIVDREPEELYPLACERGFTDACGQVTP